MPSSKGSMAPSIIYNNAAMKEIFLPGQIFVFGGFALRANSVGHLEQIDSYAPSHQISFRNLNYVAAIRGDLIFQGFAAPTTALALDLECHQVRRRESRARRTLCSYRAQYWRSRDNSATGSHHKAELSSGH